MNRFVHSLKVLYARYGMPWMRKLALADGGKYLGLITVLGSEGRRITPGAGNEGSTLPPPRPFFSDPSPVGQQYLEKMRAAGGVATGPCGWVTLEDAVVDMPSAITLLGGRVVRDLMPTDGVMANPKYLIQAYRPARPAPEVIDEAVILAMPWHHNFYMWMMQTLPRLLWLDSIPNGHHLPLLVPEKCSRFVRESLDLLGLTGRVLFLAEGRHRVRQLHAPTRLATSPRIARIGLDWMDAAYPKPEKSGGRKIYISRRDAVYHRVTNEDEVLKSLPDFEVVQLAKMPIAEQVHTFRSAGFVIGSHGAGFTLAGLMPPGSVLVELFQEGHFSASFSNLAAVRGLHHGYLVCHPDGLDQIVDLTLLGQLMDRAQNLPVPETPAQSRATN